MGRKFPFEALKALNHSAIDKETGELEMFEQVANAVMDRKTGQLLEYRQLLKHPEYKKPWITSSASEFCHLAQEFWGSWAHQRHGHNIFCAQAQGSSWQVQGYNLRKTCLQQAPGEEGSEPNVDDGGRQLDKLSWQGGNANSRDGISKNNVEQRDFNK